MLQPELAAVGTTRTSRPSAPRRCSGRCDDRARPRRASSRLGLGQEADMAEVDPEQRHVGLPGELGAPQDRAVAAERRRPARSRPRHAVGVATGVAMAAARPPATSSPGSRTRSPAAVSSASEHPGDLDGRRAAGVGHHAGRVRSRPGRHCGPVRDRAVDPSPGPGSAPSPQPDEVLDVAGGPGQAGSPRRQRAPSPSSARGPAILRHGVGAERRVAHHAAACRAAPGRPRTGA